MVIKFRELKSSDNVLQNKVELDVVMALNNKGIDFNDLSPSKKHLALFKLISICNKCKVVRQGFIAPRYNPNPKAIFISRSTTKKDLKYGNLLDTSVPQTSIIKGICDIFDMSLQDIYFTNTCMCITKSINDVTSKMCKNCYLYKKLEFETIKIPKIIFLLGNDAFNSIFDMNCTVNHILGDIFYSKYLGEYRLFIPIPHPVNLLRDKQLRATTVKLLKNISIALKHNLIEELDKSVSNK